MRFLFCPFPLFLFALDVKDFDISHFLLDSTFDGSVVRESSDTFGVIILENTRFKREKILKHTKLIKNIEIFQTNDDLYIVFGENDFDLQYTTSVLSSNRILKIIVTKNENIASNLIAKASQPSLAINAIKNTNSYITTKSPLEIDIWRYVAAIAILFALLLALIMVKRKMQTKNGREFSYFKKANKDSTLGEPSGVSISKVINIDLKNKIIVLDRRDYKYLLFVGEHNSYIIDRIQNDKISDDMSFSQLQARLA